MKGNKMSAILAIVLMLCGTLAVFPLAHAASSTCSSISANVPESPFQSVAAQTVFPYPPITNVHFEYTVNGTAGTKFWCDIDAYTFNEIATYQIGFYFNPTLLQVLAVTNGSVLNQLQGNFINIAPSINNGLGVVAAGAWSATSGWLMNGTGVNMVADLMNVEFEVNPSVLNSYLISIAGVPQNMTWFSSTILKIQSFVVGTSGKIAGVALDDGTVTYTLPPPKAPVASSVVEPSSTVTTGTPVTFDATGSTAGWSGIASVPITEYEWNFNNGTIIYTNAATPTITETYNTPGSYSVTVTVYAWTPNNSYNMSNTEATPQTVLVVAKPTGCFIDLYTQNWRYIDPFYITTTYTGYSGPGLNGTEADSFRPGDLVELFANATYNGAPVSNALVTFEVFDNTNRIVLTATAITNCYGLAEWEFRIPWPSTSYTRVNNFTLGSMAPQENTTYFGEWTAYATWQLGSQFTELPPFEKTQAGMITFDVSWGLDVTIVSITPNPAMRGPNSCGYGSDVVVKVNVYNEYLEPVQGLLTCTLYDNLLVPIYPTATILETFPVGNSQYSFASIEIPSFAFVGNGYAVVNLLSTWPSLSGTAYSPTAWATLVINAYS